MKKNDKRTGIWIPVELMNNKKLDWTNKALMSEIINLSKLEDGCIASNEHFAQLLGIGRSSVSKRITILEKIGVIVTNNIYDRKRCVGRVIQLRKQIPDSSKCTSDKNQDETILTDDNGSTKNQDMVPVNNFPSSGKDESVVPEGIDSGSQKKPNNTNNKKNINIPENIPESNIDTSQDTGENSTIFSFFNNPKYRDLIDAKKMTREQHKKKLDYLFFDRPEWERELTVCEDINRFINKYSFYIQNEVTKTVGKYEDNGTVATAQEIRNMIIELIKQYFYR